MADINISIGSGETKRLKTAGKYCKTDIVVTAGEGANKPNPQGIYQRLSYITGDGKTYFNTGYIANNSTGIELTASYTKQADSITCGSRADSGNTRFVPPYLLSSSSLYFGFNNGTSMSYSNKTGTKYLSCLNFLNSRCASLKTSESAASVVSSIAGRTLSTQKSSIAIFTFTQGSDATIGSIHNYTLYGCRISQGSEIVRDYVPCYRISDGEVGLYDMVNGEFLTKKGTGTFTVGTNVDW